MIATYILLWVLGSSLSKKRGHFSNGEWVNKYLLKIREILNLFVTSWNPEGISFLVRKLNDRKHEHTVRQMLSLLSGILTLLDHAGETPHPCTNLSWALDSASSVGDLLTLPFHCPPTYRFSPAGQKNVLLQIKLLPLCLPVVDMVNS